MEQAVDNTLSSPPEATQAEWFEASMRSWHEAGSWQLRVDRMMQHLERCESHLVEIRKQCGVS